MERTKQVSGNNGVENEPTPKSDINAKIAYDLLSQPPIDYPDDLRELYKNHDTKTQIETVEIKIDRPSANVLYMSELLIGNQDSDVEFYEKTIDRINSLPEDMRPDLVVLSGLIQGDFKLLQKSRRATLVSGLDSMDHQFRYARQMLDKASELGKPVVYNMGNDDRRVAEEYTIEVFRKMSDYAKKHDKDGGVKPEDKMNWAAIDKMRQSPHWNDHLKFQIETVFPYCLKAGRRLYTSEEMSKITDGKISVEEYFLLYDIEKRIKKNKRLSNDEYRWLRRSREEMADGIIITDDFNLHITTDNNEYNDWIRHNFGFSSEPMYQNHMVNSMASLSQLASSGQSTPDMFVTQHNQEEVGVSIGNSWVVSTGGLIDPKRHMETRGSRSDAAGDISKRLVRTRRRIPSPSASAHERTDDGRHIVTVFNDALYEKSFSIPNRLTIAEMCDFQTGSITARPDLLAKYIDYIRIHSMGERATALFFGGDMLHGRNYPHFASESQMTGLMSMDSQEAFNLSLFQEAFAGSTREELNSLQRVLVQPGNHEWNSGTLKWHGYSFVTYMRSFFEKTLARGGYSDQEISEIVKTHDAVITPKGEYASGYTGIEYFGEMGVLIQHYMMERGGKGSGGDLPVYQGHHFAAGSGNLTENIDVLMAGHWHHPQYGVFGDKLHIVGGSISGLSDYELKRGYRPTASGTLIHLGGGLPPQVEFISEQALNQHRIQKGNLTDAILAEEGYVDDEGFDAFRHGIFLPDKFAKSALQKKILQLGRDASQRTNSLAEFR